MKLLPRFFFAAVFAMLVALASPAFAHTTSVTHIDVKVDANALSVTLGLHQADLLEHVLANSGSARFADHTEYEDSAPRVLAYVLSHLTVTVDGKPLPLSAKGWPAQHVELMHTDAKGLDVPSTIAMELRGTMPHGAKRIEVSPKMFDAVNFAAMYEVSVYMGDAKPVTSVVDTHQPVAFEAMPPPAAAGASAEPAKRAVAEAGTMGFLLTFLTFVGMGFRHIIPLGLDHILFVLGLYFLSPKIKDLFWQVTAFTIAHSITLGLAAFNIFTLPSHIVEPLIALSITAVAIENLFSRNKPVRPWRWVLVFCFGLIHGLGFADVLHETHLPAGEALTAILSFNVGVEGGQLAVLLGAMGLTAWWQKREWYFPYIAAPASAMIACVGVVWTVQRIMGA